MDQAVIQRPPINFTDATNWPQFLATMAAALHTEPHLLAIDTMKWRFQTAVKNTFPLTTDGCLDAMVGQIRGKAKPKMVSFITIQIDSPLVDTVR